MTDIIADFKQKDTDLKEAMDFESLIGKEYQSLTNPNITLVGLLQSVSPVAASILYNGTTYGAPEALQMALAAEVRAIFPTLLTRAIKAIKAEKKALADQARTELTAIIASINAETP